MTDLHLTGLDMPNCEAAVERTYYEWGRGWPKDSDEPPWDKATPEQRAAITRRGYACYDGLPGSPGNRVEVTDIYLSVGINSRVIVNDAVRFLVRADQAEPLLAGIPDLACLEESTDDQIAATAALVGLFSGAFKIGWGKSTKVLHKKRPGFIPIVDSVVVDFLWKADPHLFQGGMTVESFERVLRFFRDILLAEASALGQIQTTLADRGFRLSRVRLVDYLIWIGWTAHQAAKSSPSSPGLSTAAQSA